MFHSMQHLQCTFQVLHTGYVPNFLSVALSLSLWRSVSLVSVSVCLSQCLCLCVSLCVCLIVSVCVSLSVVSVLLSVSVVPASLCVSLPPFERDLALAAITFSLVSHESLTFAQSFSVSQSVLVMRAPRARAHTHTRTPTHK